MAYTSPSNRTTGDLITSAIWNQDIVSNSQASFPDICTTAGDTVYATAADTGTRLAIGTAGYHYRSSGTAPAWSNLGLVYSVKKTADETVTSSSVLQNDDELLVPIAASETWFAIFKLFISTTATPGLKCAITIPASATMRATAVGYISASAPALGTATTSGTVVIDTANAYVTVDISVGVTNSTNAGNIQLQWAQSASNGAATVVQAQSFVVAGRVS